MRNHFGSRNPNWKGGLIKRVCPVCKESFSIKRKDVKPVNCCSGKCLGIMNRARWIAKKEARLSASRHSCEFCHKPILPSSTDIRIFKNHYCNWACFVARKKENSAGELNANWRGGITSLRHFLYNCAEALAWKEAVRSRDNYKCQECGSNHNLHVHHIKRFAILLQEFLFEYNQFSPIEDKETLMRLAINWKPFWDVRNGKTLCVDCHAQEEQHDFLKGTLIHGRT
jgi:hypothetical protein